ncbi:unnamed protein product [Moneuplotes crassus]|uniref:Uncharacterized protein n=1 Tax=Euplotes crassus TaxID=5936 RepID=A0AAD1XHU4_EUPCR|nr:unnamed protein product [Moneuplotes crassus]
MSFDHPYEDNSSYHAETAGSTSRIRPKIEINRFLSVKSRKPKIISSDAHISMSQSKRKFIKGVRRASLINRIGKSFEKSTLAKSYNPPFVPGIKSHLSYCDTEIRKKIFKMNKRYKYRRNRRERVVKSLSQIERKDSEVLGVMNIPACSSAEKSGKGKSSRLVNIKNAEKVRHLKKVEFCALMKNKYKQIQNSDSTIISNVPKHAQGIDMLGSFIKAKECSFLRRINTEISKKIKNEWSTRSLINYISQTEREKKEKRRKIEAIMRNKNLQQMQDSIKSPLIGSEKCETKSYHKESH